MQDKQAWAVRHQDLFALTVERDNRSVSMPEKKVGLGIMGVAMKRRSECASPASYSCSSSKSRKLPSRPSIPAEWMV